MTIGSKNLNQSGCHGSCQPKGWKNRDFQVGFSIHLEDAHPHLVYVVKFWVVRLVAIWASMGVFNTSTNGMIPAVSSWEDRIPIGMILIILSN